MTTQGLPTGYWNQTYAVEFRVEGDLDGSTVQPAILDSPPSGQNPNDPQNLFRKTVDALGLIDPDYTVPEELSGRLGVRGNRLVPFLWISGANAGGAHDLFCIHWIPRIDPADRPRVHRHIGNSRRQHVGTRRRGVVDHGLRCPDHEHWRSEFRCLGRTSSFGSRRSVLRSARGVPG